MADTNKETIYIDIDDEITSIIEKVRGSKHKITALVLPKRATTLQSNVNMRLLKRTADEANKNIVLITSEAGLLPIAGAVGIHVAKTLQSKPAIPAPPVVAAAEQIVQEAGEEPEIDPTKSVEELSGGSSSRSSSASSSNSKPSSSAAVKEPLEDTIDIDNTDELDTNLPVSPADKKKKKPKVPNFEKFRLRLILGIIGIIVLLFGAIFAFTVLPKAKITIKTSGKSLDSEISFTASKDATSLDEKTNVIPAVSKSTKSTDTQKVSATGEKNVGDKATGTVSLQNCSASTSTVTIPAGTAVSTGGVSFITQKSVDLAPTTLNGLGGCTTPTSDVVVTAQNGGTSGNISSGKAFIVGGFSSVSGSNSAAFTGGTDKTVTVVSQKDVDGAVAKITASNNAAKDELKKAFKDDSLFALEPTIVAGKQTVTSAPKVGEQATDVTVTVETEYTMLGIKQSELEKLLQNDLKSQIDTNKETITDYGLNSATFTLASKTSDNTQKLTVKTSAFAGAQIDQDQLKKEIAGKKQGDVRQMILALPNVDDVTVDFSPFWVSKAPKNPSKVTIVIEKTQQPSNATSN